MFLIQQVKTLNTKPSHPLNHLSNYLLDYFQATDYKLHYEEKSCNWYFALTHCDITKSSTQRQHFKDLRKTGGSRETNAWVRNDSTGHICYNTQRKDQISIM